MKNQYFEQVRLLLELLPITLEDERFALKGGTAINLFYRDMNRLSVDIDLCYLPIELRDISLDNIRVYFALLSKRIKKLLPDSTTETRYTESDEAKNILVKKGNATVKIEVNLIVRGALYPTTNIKLSSKAEALFNITQYARCLSLADVYGGKICACLDRQHPRDWYDSWILLENEGITEEIKKAFILYLLSGKRPISEMLDPYPSDQRVLYNNELVGMDQNLPPYAVLAEVRRKLATILLQMLTEEEKRFLVSFKQGCPEWKKSGINNLEDFPAVKWKLYNIQKMPVEKRNIALKKLRVILGV